MKLLILILLLLAPVLLAQEEPVPSSPEALAILDQAIAYQGPAKFAVPGAIKDLTVNIGARAWDHSQKPPQKFALDVRRFLTLDPERFRSEWRSGGETQIQGFDGTRYWYADSEINRYLLGDDVEQDRKAIRSEIDQTRHMLQLFFLANLKGPKVSITKRPDQVLKLYGKEVPCHVIHRLNLSPASKEPPLTIWIDSRNFELRKAMAHATGPDTKALIFFLRHDLDIQPRIKGVLFPYRIEIWEQPHGLPKPRCSVIATINEVAGIRFNTGLPAKIFLRPAQEEK